MPTLDPRVDAYIERAAPFARDLLRHWRAAVHTHCPDVVETIKWGFPNFTYRAKILTSMAAFNAHCSIGFWHGEAKKAETRERRLAQAVEWLAEGKRRNWKYENC
ncbi:DUF1801 domain-containing protein [Mitsuaria sp. CC2]|uniref:DUF1801 domain-containing protein n=1 Tax=Mitsuaria sp. CC2 TaxID=3029186 RepID=UPI003B8E61CD